MMLVCLDRQILLIL